MSFVNVKNFFLFTLLIIAVSLSVLLAQEYLESYAINLLSMLSFVILIVFATTLSCFFSKNFFKSSLQAESFVSDEQFFSYTQDPATSLPTAQQALTIFESIIKSKIGQRHAAVVFKPVNFSQANSLLGYHNSDLLLLQLAYCLQRKVEDNDNLVNFSLNLTPVRIAKLQNFHFLVLYDLTDCRFDDKSVLNDLCQQLKDAVPDAMSFKNFSLNFELAFGIAISGEHGNNFDEIVFHASNALLSGLKSGQQVNYFDNESILHTQSQLARIESFRQAFQAEKLTCYLKPQVNINNYNIIGFQLKMHWYETEQSKPLGLSEFWQLAEQSGELYHLTKYMFSTAFTTLATLKKIGVYQLISVSLASESLFEVDLVDFIEQQLESHGIAGKYLMIELNEDLMLNSSQRVKRIIDQLKSLDINISIANFSGSYESLRYVRKMRVEQLKVNCQQLSNDASNRVDKAHTNALLTLTRSMKIPLVGTYIDKHEASQAYIAMGGELIQGNIIHPGIIPSEIETWLEKWYLQHPQSIPPEAKPSIY